MSELYKLPKKPVSIGGGTRAPIVVFFGGILAANWYATTQSAEALGHQSQLGWRFVHPMGWTIYKPWAIWEWAFAASDPAVHGILNQGIATAAGFSLLAFILAVLIGRKSNRKLDDYEDIHGSARWANKQEIKATGLLDAKEGVYVGGWQDGKTLRYLRHKGPEHVLAFARTRSGKGVSLVIPTLLAWTDSVLVYDIKGENWTLTSGWRSKLGPCYRFAPADLNSSHRFNPLGSIRINTLKDVADAQNMASMLTMDCVNTQNNHFRDSAKVLLTGMILHVCYSAHREGKEGSLGDVNKLLKKPGQPFETTLKTMLTAKHLPDGSTHPLVAGVAQDFIDRQGEEFASVLSTAKTAMELFDDDVLCHWTSASDFSIDDLVNKDKPVSLYLVNPPNDKIRLRPLVRIVVTLIIDRLCSELNAVGYAHRLLLMLDEFPSLGRMQVFADALSYMAGYGIISYLITQDIRQVEEIYGPKESISGNCSIICAFAATNPETQKLLSEMAGISTVRHESETYSGSRKRQRLPHMSATLGHFQRPLLTPDEVGRLPGAVKRGEGVNERIVAPGKMLTFVTGHRPIFGMQILYFADPILLQRSQIEPLFIDSEPPTRNNVPQIEPDNPEDGWDAVSEDEQPEPATQSLLIGWPS